GGRAAHDRALVPEQYTSRSIDVQAAAVGSRVMQMDTAVARVDVDTQADGRTLVRWELEGTPAAVDVAGGPTADHSDHTHEATVPAGQTSLVVAGRGDGRLFVSVSPQGTGPAVVAADRRVPFVGAQNFRDMGGYRTRSGRIVRWGRVFRADALHGL